MAKKEKNVKDLEKENQQLKRQLAQAQRELIRLNNGDNLDPEPTETDVEHGTEPTQCGNCGSKDIGHYITPFGHKKIFGCKSCKKWRFSIPSKESC